MPPIIKDSDMLETSETSSRRGSAASGDSATRPQPVALEVPITVNGARTVDGGDKREPFSESTKTVMVHGNGAVIKLNSALAPGQLLFLTNERTKKEVVCQVVKSKNYRKVSGYVELEFTEPALGFWGMRFPGDRIQPGPPARPEAGRPAAGNGSPAPAAPKLDPPAASSVDSKPSASVQVSSEPRTPAASGSSIVPAPIDSGSLLGTVKPNREAPPAAPVTTLFGSEERLVEPWLKKREPVSRVPAEPPSVARPVPAAKTELPAPIEPPARDFGLPRPSDKAASLFAPSEPPSNPATVDLSSLAPFFKVKPAPADMAPLAPPKAPAASDPETDEIKHHTKRLEEELSQMQFAEPAALPVKPTIEPPPISVEKPSLPKAETVHESAAEFLENPVGSSAPAVLPEAPKLEERWKVEPRAPIPAFESLEEEELKIPAWLAPLARNASAPSSTKDLVLREKAKRIADQPSLEELMAPLAAPLKPEKPADPHVPQFGSALLFEGPRKVKDAPKKSGKGLLFAVLAGTVLLAGGWWYKSRQAGGVLAGTFARQVPDARATSEEAQANSPREAALAGMLPVHKDREAAPAKPDASSANVPVDAAPADAISVAARNPNGGTPLVIAESAEPGAAPAEKKPVLGEVHLGAPKISAKRTSSSEPEVSLNEEPPEGEANALGANLGASSKQPAAPAAPGPGGGEVTQARLISSVPPEYPGLAKARHISGGVTIDALIDANGRVIKMKVLSGPTLLEQAAMDSLRQWKYQPAMLDGKAVPVHLTVTVQFRLQ